MTNGSRSTRHIFLGAGVCLALFAAPGLARAQHITVDGRLSPAQTLVGPAYSIGANLGKQVGGNLFHSFGLFGLTQSETATFTPTGSTGPITNVIGRVTGGAASSIDGAIKSTIAGANLYLINPAGIVFGPHGTVNVGGSFHASTADYIRMSDGARFQATNPDGSTLSAAPPAAFGFLSAAPGAITVNGSRLAVPTGQTLGLVGGPVTISNGAYLHAPSGTIHVTSAAGTGEVPVDPRNTSALTVATLGPVDISSDLNSNFGLTSLDVSDLTGKTSGGSIFIKSGTLTIADNAALDGTNDGAGAGGQISLLGTSQIALSSGATIYAPALGTGRGADIILTTGHGGSISASGADTVVEVGSTNSLSGDSGKLTVTTGNLTLTSGAVFSSAVLGSGSTGAVSITANSVVLDGRAPAAAATLTGIRSYTAGGSANAADITVNAGTLTILANGEIVTNTFGAGNAGRVSVAVAGPLSIDATGAKFSTGIGSVVSPIHSGNAGNVTITAGSLSIIGNPFPLSPTLFSPNPFSGVSARTESSGNGGSILVDLGTGPLRISDGGVISTSTSSTGKGGDIDVTAGNITLAGLGPQITARSTGTGDAGAIMISALNLKLKKGASIATDAATANGGNITLAVKDFLYLVDSQVTTSVHGSIGNGGNIVIDPQLLVLDNSQIIAQAVLGHGGNITIFANDFFPSTDSLVSASSALGISGTVEIIGPRVDLDGSLVVLPSELKNAAAVLRTSCAARGNRPRSSLTEAGRGGLPQDPEATLLAVRLADRDFTPGLHTAAAVVAPHDERGHPALTAVRLKLHCG